MWRTGVNESAILSHSDSRPFSIRDRIKIRSRIEGYGPRPRPARDWPVPKLGAACRRASELWPQAIAQSIARGSWPVRPFSKSAILHHFPNFYTLRVYIFQMFFYLFTSTYDPYEPWKVSWKSIRKFLRNQEDRHTHTQTDRRSSFIFIDYH